MQPQMMKWNKTHEWKLYPANVQRGSGVLRKGQHSWNISVMKQARMDPKVVLELLMECPSWEISFRP